MTAVQSKPGAALARHPGTPRQRIGAGLCLLLAVAMLVTGLVGIGRLHPYQVALDIAAAVLLVAFAVVLVRSGTRWPVGLVTWLSVLGVIAEFGDYQSRRNDTGALGATNTTYFLPALLWLYMFLLVVLAIVIMSFAARPKELG